MVRRAGRDVSVAAVHNGLFKAKGRGYQRSAYPHAVAHLAPVHRARIAVAARGYLVAPRQRVHYHALGLENRKHREAWRAGIHGVAKSQTRLSD